MFYTFYRQRGNNIQLRYKKGKETLTKVVDFYEPHLFSITDEESEYKDIYGNNLNKMNFPSIKDAREFGKQFKDIENYGLCGNSDYANQFIIELLEGQVPEYDPSLIKIGRVDIETDSETFPDVLLAPDPVNAITIHNSLEDKYYSFFLAYEGAEWDHSKSDDKVINLKVEAQIFTDEKELLRAFLMQCHEQAYDILSGWNSDGFDIPYLVNRCYNLLGKRFTQKMLSPFGEIQERETVDNFKNKVTLYQTIGTSCLDYLDMYKKLIPTNQESYKLDYIAHVELGERKISYEESKSLYRLYREDFQKFCDYNIQDVNLLVRLEQKLGLFDLIFATSYYCLSNFNEALGKVKIWENLIARFLYNKKIAPFYKNGSREKSDFDGAYVKEPVPGFYRWVVAFDLNGLYPHCIMQWNIGPETHIPYEKLHPELQAIVDSAPTQHDILSGKIDTEILKKHNVSMTPNLQFYTLEKMSFLSEIDRELYDDRKSFKKKMLDAEAKQQQEKVEKLKAEYKIIEKKMDNMQKGLKLLLNGGYGALGNPHFLYYLIANAEGITSAAQVVNKWTAFAMEKYLKEEVFKSKEHVYLAGDTDSMYLTIDQFVRTLNKTDVHEIADMCDWFCKNVLAPFIDKRGLELATYLNCYEQKMVWEREVIAVTAVWRKKKNYMMNVIDSEGVRYNEPKLKITGLEAKKMIVPEWSRKYLKECYKLILEEKESELHDKIDSVKNEFNKYDINDIALPSGINGVQKYYDERNLCIKGTQMHVRGALIHNKLLLDKDIKTIPPIKDGDKIRYLQLKMPNPCGQPVISFDTYLPEEFGLDKYADKDIILEKSFLSPIRSLLDVVGWREEETVTLF